MNETLQFDRIRHFLSWWRAGLVAWLPEKWRGENRQRAHIQCVYTSDSLLFRRVDKQGGIGEEKQFNIDTVLGDKAQLEKWLSRYPEDEIVLCVAEEKVLSKRINLPIQARENLSAVIQFEIDRQTPFKPEQVYTSFDVVDRDTTETTLSVLLSVVPKQSVAPTLEILKQLGLSPSKLVLQSQKGADSQVTLLAKTKRQSKGSLVNYGLAAFAFILLLLVLYQPLYHYESLSEAIIPELAQAKKQATQVNALKRENEAILNRLKYVDVQLAKYRQRIIILNELAMVLPVHTWLERSEIQGPTITLAGESSAASDLISLLTETGHFDDVHFSAPTTHNNKSGKEHFQIEALIKLGDSHASD
jgi:general secretion pathway protein L